MTCYRSGGCGPYEMYSCSECPYSKPQNKEKNISKNSIFKYLEELGLKDEDIPQLCLSKDDRRSKWKEQRDTYGFDEREVWNIDKTFLQWLYCRLKMYNEYNCIDTSFHIFEFNDRKINLQCCIDIMIKNLEYLLLNSKMEENWDKKCDETLDIFKLCFHSLWW